MAPVCGKNGRTYGNACMAKCAKTAVVSKGKCKKCPKVMIKCKCGQTYTMVKGCKVPKCKTTCDKKTTPKKKPAAKFAMAGSGKASCSGKGAPVKNIDGCKKAATAMKKKFGGSGAYASYPKGCFVYNNQFYYNTGKTGKGNSKARPVCVGKATGGKKTTPKKKPKFAMAGNGKDNCGKLAPVKSENACKAAAKAMKKPFGGSSASAFNAYPKGCFLNAKTKKFYYNKGKTGKGNSQARPVCVGKATGGKKTTPKKKPVCKCPKNMAPVCGKNGRTYSNACMAKCAKTAVVAKGACKKGSKVQKCKTTCDKKPTPKKKPAAKFAMAGSGKASCSGKGAPVKNIDGCKKAATAMKKKFGSSGAYASYPKGCFVYNNALYYNTGKTGKGNSKARPVCVGKATGGKKTTPKKKPK